MILITNPEHPVSHFLIRQLRAWNKPFIVALPEAQQGEKTLSPDIEWIHFDFADETTYLPALTAAEKLFLLLPCQEEAQQQAMRLIEAARERNLRQIVLISILHADKRLTHSLGRWLRRVELFLVASGVPGTILRPNVIMDEWAQQMCPVICRENTFYISSAQAAVSYIAAQDVAAVAAECLWNSTHINKSYDLTGPRAINAEEMAVALSLATGRAIEYAEINDNDDERCFCVEYKTAWQRQIRRELDMFVRRGWLSVVNRNIPLILGRPAQDFYQWAQEHRELFQADSPPD